MWGEGGVGINGTDLVESIWQTYEKVKIHRNILNGIHIGQQLAKKTYV
jgi:hypothetical protein